MTVYCAQCGNYCDLVSHIFGKNFVKVTFLPKKSLKSRFDEKIFGETEFFVFPHCAVENAEILSHTFSQKFLESNCLTKKLLNSWFDEIFAKEVWERISRFSTLCLYDIKIDAFDNLDTFR